MKNARPIVKYAITVVAGLVFCLVFFLIRDLFQQTDAKTIFLILCDGFFVVGALMVGVWLLSLCINAGSMDSLGFALHTLFATHSLSKERFDNRKSYLEYKEEKAEARTKLKFYILFVGVGFLVVAVIFLIIYKQL